MRIPVEGQATLVGVFPKTTYEDGHYTKNQEKDADTGLPLWSVEVETEGSGRYPDRLRVTVASAEEPVKGAKRGTPVELVGQAVNWWTFRDGRTVVKVTADEVKAA